MEDTNAADDRWALPAVVTPEESQQARDATARLFVLSHRPAPEMTRLLESVPAPGVTHLHYEVAR